MTTAAMADGHATDLTLCWAAWDPANSLIDWQRFEEQSGHTMNFEFVPWTSTADRMLNELNSGGQLV
jgi:multiple sugar transport system substrate-binding protein